MWPFERRQDLPGIEWDAEGEIIWAFTDEEEAEVQGIFSNLEEVGEQRGKGGLHIHADAHKAMTAWALVSYAKAQVFRGESQDSDAVSQELCLRKALAALSKAYLVHPLPIHMFDVGCLLEMLQENASARNAFKSFLEMHQSFKPSAIDEYVLKHRDIEAAVREARQRLGTEEVLPR